MSRFLKDTKVGEVLEHSQSTTEVPLSMVWHPQMLKLPVKGSLPTLTHLFGIIICLSFLLGHSWLIG